MTNLPFNDPGNASLRGPVDMTKAQRDFTMAEDIFISCARPEYRITFYGRAQPGFALCCSAITVRHEFDFQKIKLIKS